jgi:metallo-beta-lactamase family protein
MNLKLAFYGGAGTVTGSKHVLTAGSQRVLIDCGMFQGVKELRLMNWRRTPFAAASVRNVVLTHAHIDHSGYLPRLLREGFAGNVYCTPATRELSEVLLTDAAKLQEEDAEYANRKGFSRHHPALPLFTVRDAERVIKHSRTSAYGRWFRLGEHVEARLHDAGHILGSAFVETRIALAGRVFTIVFSGDIGRYGVPLHTDPQPPPPCDAMVIESTYGDRQHDRTSLIDQIRRPFKETIARGGTILIPAFAVARAQVLTLMLRALMDAGDLPDVPLHIDSPMAIEATRVYRRHIETGELDPQSVADWDRVYHRVEFHSTVEESRALNHLSGGRIIISASGMMTGGRVLHHLRRLLPDEKNLVVLAGYQAPGTRGRALLEGAMTLRMHGRDVPARAEVLPLSGLSAHADAGELMRWLRSGTALPQRVFVVHGEPPAASSLAARIEQELRLHVDVPAMGDEVDLSHVS